MFILRYMIINYSNDIQVPSVFVFGIAKERWWDIDYFNGTISENVREDGSTYSS